MYSLILDDKDEKLSQDVLAELENIDDECDQKVSHMKSKEVHNHYVHFLWHRELFSSRSTTRRRQKSMASTTSRVWSILRTLSPVYSSVY